MDWISTCCYVFAPTRVVGLWMREHLGGAEDRFDLADGFFDIAGAVGNRDFGAVTHQAFDFFLSGNDGAMAAAAEEFADLAQGGTGVFSCEPHGQHSRLGDRAAFTVGLEAGSFDAEDFANGALDVVEPHRGGVLLDELGQGRAGQVSRNGPVVGHAGRGNSVQGPAELAGAAGDLGGDQRGDFVVDADVSLGGDLPNDA